MVEIIKRANDLLSWLGSALLVINIIIGFVNIGFFVFIWFRKERKIFNNLKRTIYFFEAGNGGLGEERELIKNSGLFKVGTIFDFKSRQSCLNCVNKFSVFILKYSPELETDKYNTLVSRASQDNIPLIVFSESGQIKDGQRFDLETRKKVSCLDEPNHLKIFSSYPYFDMCNSQSRLLSVLFTLTAITPINK